MPLRPLPYLEAVPPAVNFTADEIDAALLDLFGGDALQDLVDEITAMFMDLYEYGAFDGLISEIEAALMYLFENGM
jgi:hypothetical protein